MPRIGEIRRAKEIGYTGWSKHIWHACVDCGKERWVQYNYFKAGKRIRCKECGYKLRGRNQRGANAPSWRGGCHINPQGYIMVYLFVDDPFYEMTCGNGYAREHRLVMAKHLGRILGRREFVHHKNGVKTDNRIGNLELVTPEGHMGYHVTGYRDGYKKGLKDGRSKQITLLKS